MERKIERVNTIKIVDWMKIQSIQRDKCLAMVQISFGFNAKECVQIHTCIILYMYIEHCFGFEREEFFFF